MEMCKTWQLKFDLTEIAKFQPTQKQTSKLQIKSWSVKVARIKNIYIILTNFWPAQ